MCDCSEIYLVLPPRLMVDNKTSIKMQCFLLSYWQVFATKLKGLFTVLLGVSDCEGEVCGKEPGGGKWCPSIYLFIFLPATLSPLRKPSIFHFIYFPLPIGSPCHFCALSQVVNVLAFTNHLLLHLCRSTRPPKCRVAPKLVSFVVHRTKRIFRKSFI